MRYSIKAKALVTACLVVLGFSQTAYADFVIPIDPVPGVTCTFNNVVLAPGSSVTAYQNSSVGFGKTCVSEQRTCAAGVLSGSYNFDSCSVGAPIDCTFNGATVSDGSSVTAFVVSNVSYGNSCASVAETRTCSNGVLSGSAAYGSCTVDQPASCLFNGQTISSGDSVQAYATSNVSYNSTCSSETRTCLNGILSGSNSYGSCTVGQPASCLFNGITIANGQVVTAYPSASVPYGQACASESRTCNNGVLSGNISSTFDSCVAAAPASCTFNGQVIASGSSVQAYPSASVPFGSQCVAESRSCENGVLSGSAVNASCAVQAAANCSFNGSTVLNGSSVVAYPKSSVPYGSTCAQENRTCSNGVLSGSATNASCTVEAAPVPPTQASCSFNGSQIQSGASVIAYLNATVPYGSQCSSQTRTCKDGALSGSAANASCAVQPAADCSFNGAVVKHGASVIAYPSSSVAYGSTCVQENRTCNNGVLSGSAANASCTVQPAPTVPPVVTPPTTTEIFWEFPEGCGCGNKNSEGYRNSIFSINAGKTWSTITGNNKAPDNLQAIWDQMVKQYGLNKCKRPNVKYVKGTHHGYVKFDKPYLPKPSSCRFIEVTDEDDDHDHGYGRYNSHDGRHPAGAGRCSSHHEVKVKYVCGCDGKKR